ncbi:hypothetical protein [Leptolyngbya sp. Heron Island J]|uniref:hypothetical protein n=1 Tax=Leptolyngbya sp. Heron Island J TaxID=1385935 RepID=UPI001F3D7089|nr:hypothetical protein [Leptolyngbya sp. Heron Island J]
MHALSPSHGKTLVGAYLVGSRSTPQAALWLGLTTTVTHTLAVFILGVTTRGKPSASIKKLTTAWRDLLTYAQVQLGSFLVVLEHLNTEDLTFDSWLPAHPQWQSMEFCV